MVFDTHNAIRMRQYGKVSWQSGMWDEGRINTKYHLLLYVDNGSFRMKVDKKTYTCTAGDFLLIPAGIYHKPLESDGTSYCFFEIYPQNIEITEKHIIPQIIVAKYVKTVKYPGASEATDSYNFYNFKYECSPYINVETLTHCLDNIQVKSIIGRMSDLDMQSNANNMILAEQLLRELLVIISTELNENRYNKALHDILEYISANFADSITLSELSKRFSLSESYIARLFNKKLGTTLSEYVNTLRIQFACTLLRSSSMKLCEIAEKTGFSNQYYFSRVFKKIHGTTPIKFRKNEK